MKKDRKIIPIKESELALAADDMEPTLAMVYDKYGAEVTLLALQYMTAKAIVFSPDLTEERKSALIKQSSKNLEKFARMMSNYLSNGSEV